MKKSLTSTFFIFASLFFSLGLTAQHASGDVVSTGEFSAVSIDLADGENGVPTIAEARSTGESYPVSTSLATEPNSSITKAGKTNVSRSSAAGGPASTGAGVEPALLASSLRGVNLVMMDSDNDGVPDADDTQPNNPCVPNAQALACETADTDGDGVTNGDECGGAYDDMDNDGVLAFLDDDDGDGAILNDDNAIEAEFDVNGNNIIDCDDACFPVLQEDDAACANVDPTGFIFCAATGEIIAGGTVSISSTDEDAIVTADGSTGRYQFFSDPGTTYPVTYTITYTPPAGSDFQVDPDAVDEGPLTAPNDGDGDQFVGSDDANNDGFVDDVTDGANPYITTVTFEDATDEDVFLLNIPLIGCMVPIEVDAQASCEDEDGNPADPNTYFVRVDTLVSETDGPFDVTVAGVTQTYTPGMGDTLFFGPFTHSGSGNAVQVVSVVDQTDAAVNGLGEAVEVLCNVRPEGGQMSGGFCMPTTDPDALTGAVLAQSAPGSFMAGGTSGQVQTYVLVNSANFIVESNMTGLFMNLPSDTFQVFAINYRDTEPLEDFLQTGQSFDPVLNGVNADDTDSPLDGACYTICNTDPIIMVPVNCLSIGSTVFTDIDDDATFESGDGEMGIADVTVNLFAESDPVGAMGVFDSLVATTTTDDMGNYFFGGLDEGDYIVSIPTAPDGFPISSTNDVDPEDATGDDMDSGIQAMAGDSVVSPVINLMAGAEPTGADEDGLGSDQDDNVESMPGNVMSDDDINGDMTVDFGFFPGLSLGSTVFQDLDNDGLQGPTEMGIGGVTVNLYEDVDGNGTYDAGSDTLVTSTTTDPVTGDYFFDMLPESGYFVSVLPDDMFPVSSTGAGQEDDPNMDVDGNDNGVANAAGDMMLEAGEEVFSGLVTLSPGDEPTNTGANSTSTGMEDAISGADQDGDADSPEDANGNMTVDFGFFPGLSIGSTVFNDNNNDGILETTAGEAGIDDVRVYLTDENGVRIDSTFTANGGNYFFDGLVEGTYMVEIGESAFVPGGPLSDVNTSSTPTETGDEDIDNNDNGIQVGGPGTVTTSGPIVLELGNEPINGGGANDETGPGATQDDDMDANGNMTIDFGFYTPVSIGSQVFYDADNSGDNNGNTEPGIDGVTVNLYEDTDDSGDFTPGVDVLVDMTVTMNGGLYEFDTLSPGNYIVGVVPPDTARLSSNGPAENTADDQSDGNDNGIQEMVGDEIFSVAINLTPGEEPTDEDDAGDGGDQDNVALEDNDGDMTIDFGLVPSVSVGSTVFVDNDNNGLLDGADAGVPGIIVTLLDDMMNVVATDTTDADGNYFFDGLPPGDYQLSIPMVPDSLPTSSTNPATSGDEMTDNDDDGNQDMSGDPIFTDVFTLSPNDEPVGEPGQGNEFDDVDDDNGNSAIDFGLVPNFSLGSTVFEDLDNDAMQGPDEEGVAGVPVTLYSDVDMDGYTPGVDTIVATTTTDDDGNYFFDGLLPGDYVVGIIPTDELPLSSDEMADEDDPNLDMDGNDNGMQAMVGDSIFSGTVTLGGGVDEPSGADEGEQGGDQDDASMLADVSGNQTVDFGLFPGVSLGSTVFADLDNSGAQDAGEDGIADVPVLLYSDEDGDGFTPGVDTVVAMTTTDGMGNYFFDNLPEGNYVVAVAPSDEFPVSSTGAAADMAAADTDNNTDGNDSGILNSMNMAPAAFDTVFSGTIELVATEEPTGGDESAQGGDQDDESMASDANGNMTVDFGFFPGLSIGSTVFFDNDNDGLYEPSDSETGIAGVQVFLYADDGVTVLDSTTTDSEGNYFFGNLDAGDYIVGIPESSFGMGQPLNSAPSSSTTDEVDPNDDVDQNDNGLQPGGAGTIVQSGIVTLEIDMEPTAADGEIGEGADQDDDNDANGNMTVDFGFFPTVSIGSQVFLDIDNSGDNNGGTEMGIDDVEVLLFADVDGNNQYTPGVDTLVDMTVTMGGGLYEFDTLAPGDYIVAVVPPLDNNLSSNGPGESTADDQTDDNDNGIQAMAGDTVFSTAINLMVGDEPEGESGPGGDQDDDDDQDDDGDMTVDFGLLPSLSVGSTVFQDRNGDGLQGDVADEPGVEGIIVTLRDADGNVVATDTTDMDGAYFFDGLTPGDYELVINMVPDSLPNSSDFPAGEGDDGVDGNDNGIQDGPGQPISSGIFTLTPDGEPVDEMGTNSDLDDANEDDGDVSFDFGLVPDYSIGSTVFADLDNNGLQEGGEEGVAGVEVTLYLDSDMDGMITSADSVVATTTTDDDGNYFFDNLQPGEYGVGIVPTDDLPFSSNDDEDEDDANTDVDGDDNGSQPGMMAGDSIFSGVLSLGTDGMDEPVEGAEDGQGGDQDDDTALQDASGNQTLDLGLFPGVSLGSTVFADTDNDGMQGDDEDGISDLPVILYADVNMDGLFDPAVDTVVAETTTDGDGNYFFDRLPEGDYFVGVVPSPEFPLSSMNGEEADPNTDVDNNDNGIQNPAGMTPMAGDTVLSGVVTLSGGDEPDGADEPASGGDQDDDNDTSGNMTVDFAFNPGVSIGSTVFFDLDNDGVFEESDGESGIPGVEVFLYADDGVTVLDSTTTDSEGNYFFGGLDEGDYVVGIPASSFEVGEPLESAPNSSTPTDGEADDQVDNNDNGMQPGGAGTIVTSNVITLMLGDEPTAADGENGTGAEQDGTNDLSDANGDMTVDFGFFPTLSIGSQVFLDIDNSGDNNGGTEMGIDGVEVLLFADVDGNNEYTPGVDTLVDMTVTMGGGLYEFDTLTPGDYIVAVVPPLDNNLSSNGPGESTADDQVDNNDNGIQAMAGDTVFSTAINLMVGDEPEGEPGPGGDQDDDDDQDDDGDMTVDFGLLPSVSVGSTVFQDRDGDGTQGDAAIEPGVPGIIVTLLDDDGNVVAMDTTDEDGAYFFDGLTPGDYELVINMVPDSLPNSSDFPAGEGDDGVDGNDNGIQDGPGQPISSGIFTLTPNGEPVDEMGTNSDLDDANEDDGDVSIDFGLVPDYSIGSTVFADLDNNGLQDGGEEGVAGVEVTLYLDSDMDGMITSADSVVATTTTDDDGNYFFDNLQPGEYGVGIVPTDDLPFSSNDDEDEDDANTDVDGDDNGSQPGMMAGDSIFSGVLSLGTDGMDEPVEGAEDGQGGDQDDDTALQDASGNQTLDLGLFPGVSLGSTVFADRDNDGMQGDDEDGISDLPVILYADVNMDGLFDPAVDTVVAETTTDGDGNYFFDRLPEGDYFVGVVPSPEFPLSSMNGEEADPNADVDNNDNGIQNPAGMTPMAGDTVLSGVVTLSGGDEPDGADEPASGGDQDDDNDTSGNMTVDFAFNPGVSIGSTVFFDLDNDGVFEESNGETGIQGVEVFLYAGDGVTVLDSTITDDNGNYFFGGLDEGDYVVGIPASSFEMGEPLESAPNSSTPTDGEADDQVDNNDNGMQPGGAGTIVTSNVINLMIDDEPTAADGETGEGSQQDDANDASGDMTVDFGFFPTVSIGSQVFLDIDNSGDNNGGTEMGIDDVEVLLFADVDGNNQYTPGVDTLVDMTVTMGGGLYEFDTLAPGDYIVAVVPPLDNNLSSNGPGESTADDQVDNNDNGIQAMAGDTVFSTAINLMVGDEPEGEPGPGGDQDDDDAQDDDGDMTVDFGLLPSVSVGSTVFQDRDGDGTQGDVAVEPGVPGIIVTLLDDDGNVVAMDTTDEDGAYYFDGLTPGDYELVINMVPDSLPNSSDFPAGEGDDGVDGNDNGIQDGTGQPISSGIFTLTPNGEPVDEMGTNSDLDDANEDDGDVSIDFGLVPDYSIGSTVFADLDNNGLQDGGEEGVAGVEVTLYLDSDMDGMITSADSVVATTTTDDDGNYFFDNLQPGEYGVGIVPTDDLPFSSNDDEDEDDANTDVDGDDNGSQPGMMAGDSIFSGVLSLGTDGMDEPVEGAEDGQGGDQDDDTALQDASGNQTLDLGLFPGVSLGSTVFADTDNDGMQGDDEDGISDLPVILYADVNMDGMFDPAVDTVVAETMTDGDGDYFFDRLPEGDYFVGVVPSPEFPISSVNGEEADPNADVDNNDNGIQNPAGMTPMAGDTVLSGVVTLSGGDEPEGAAEPASGGDQDDDNDSSGNMTVDFAFSPGVSIGSTVFFDLDNDGIFEESDGETGIAGVEVFLYADDGITVLDSTTTDSDGNYFFGGLDEGDYVVGIPASSFEVGEPLESAPNSSTPTDGEADDQVDNNDNGMQPGGAGTIVTSNIITLMLGDEPTAADGENGEGADQDGTNDDGDANGDMTVDFGFFPTLSIGSQVFLDIDNSGDNNGGTEMGIDDVEVLLFADVDGNNQYTPGVDTLVDMTVTMGGGLYEFDTLPPGDYIVAVVPPLDNNLSSNGPGESTADDQVDNNDNGIQAMAGDTVFSTAIDLSVGDEPVGESGPGGDQDDEDDQDDDGDMTVDFGLLPSVSVGSTVFQDTDGDGTQGDEGVEPGVPGIIVTLLDDDGNVVAMDTTDEDGAYFFDGLTPGDYELVINMVPDSLPNSSDFPAGEGDDGVDGNDNGIQDGPGQPISSGIFTLTPNGEPVDEMGTNSDLDDANEDDGDVSIDFGLVPDYSIGSTVFADLDNNGLQDGGEEGVAGVEVTLYLDSDMDGMITSADSVVATTTTDDDGNYFFDNLQPGEYGVGIVPTDDLPFSSNDDEDEDDANTDVDGDDNGSQPGMMAGDSIFSGVLSLGTDGMDEPVEGAEDGQGGDQDDDTALQDASGNQTLDFGLFPGVSLGSTVFADTDNDGMQGDDEDGISDLPVILYADVNMDGMFDPTVDTVVAETTTDGDGNYFFDMLPEGDYFVGVVPSPEFPLSSNNGEEADPNADVDNNDNGIQNPAGMTPMVGDTVLSGVVTLSGGDEPEGADEPASGGDQDDDNDSSGNMTVDFALNPGVSIGSTVFFDLDNDGVFEESDGETGIAGVEVFLYAADGVTVLDSTTTDSDGNYFFGGLDEGDYVVGIPASSFEVGEPLESAPNSSIPTDGEADDQVDNNDNGMQPGGAGTIVTSNVITLMLGDEPTAADGENGEGADQDGTNDDGDANGDMTVDFGFFPTLSIGSQVFLDIDNSGDNNGGTEMGIDGVEVLLFADTDGNNMYTPGVDVLVDMTTTMDGGLYEFDTLPPGDYIVAVLPPLDNNLSSNGPGESTADDQVDNNDNGIQAMAGDTVFSTAINLSVGDEPVGESGPGGELDDDDDQDDDGDMTVDFGLLPSVSVGSTVFQDTDGDGTQGDEGVEPGVPGIIVTLLDDDGNVVAMDTTDEDGAYYFDGLTPGDYELVINMVPDGLPNSSDFPAGEGDDGVDGNDNGIQDGPGQPISSGIFTLTPNGEPVDEMGTNSDLDDANEDDGDVSIDFGLVPNYSVGSTVFADLDNDAMQGDDEDGVPGVEVTLYLDSDMDGMITSADSVVATTTTDEDGNYFFDNLFPGDYGVSVIPADDLPISSDDDLDSDDANDDVDGDDNGAQEMPGDTIFSSIVTLGDGEPTGNDEDGQGGDQDDDSALEDASGNMSLDIGLFPGVSVGSTVFADMNNDGFLNSDESGIEGVLVILYDNATMMAVDSAFTNEDGNYFFSGLPEGDYYIEIPGDQLVGGNGLFDMDASSSTPDFNPDDDIDNNDDGTQDGGPGTTIVSGVFTLSAGDEPVNGVGGEINTGATQDDQFDASGNMTIDFGIFTNMFDLALIKELAPGQSPNVNAGDTVAFRITVINQGNLAADSIVISDYVPTQMDGFTFDQSLNPDWTVESTINDTTRLQTVLMDFDGADTLAPGAFTTTDIFLVVNPAMGAVMPLTNLAEISDATGPNGEDVTDIDSPMDTIPGNDNFFEDNEIDGNGLAGGDEDNSDPATILVGGFDLALIKTLSAGQSSSVSPGDQVSFDITVINQGAITADNVVVVDYVPAGLLFDPALNLGWSLNADGNPIDTLSIANGDLFEGGLEPGESTTTQIVLTVAPPMFPDFADGTGMNPDGVESGQSLVNAAEIADATDEDGNEVTDIDSTNDDIDGNDGEVDDDDVNGGGDTDGDGVIDDDEDDNDIAIVTVECFQDPGVDNEIQVCLGCDEAVVTINLFESLGGLPNIGGVFAEGSLTFMDEDGNAVAVDLSDPENVVIPGTLDRSRDYSITYTIPAVNGCSEMTSTIVIDIFDIQNLSCTGFQNISLGEDCNAEITPELILQGNLFCASSLEVVLLTTSGDTIRDENGLPTAFVGNDQINQTLMVSLVDPMCDNSCWGQILVEDKKRPTIECPADISGIDGIDFICTDIDSILNLESSFAFTGAPVIADNCTPTDELELEFYDLLLPNDDPMCTPSTILRTFIVTDESGNSNRCVQEITVRPATLADVTIPTENFFTISCDENLETLPSGNPLPSVTPQPFVTTALGTYPLNASSTYCSLASQFTDSQAIQGCENSFEFTRTYTLFDWCEPTNDPVTFSQIIKVDDFTAPEFTSTQTNFEYEVNTAECGAIFRLDDPGIRIIDNCSQDITVTAVIYPDGDTLGAPIGTFFLDFQNGEQELSTEIPLGDHVIRYTYEDGCGNQASTDVPFSVVDRTAPAIVCEDGINVGLSMDGPNGVGTAALTPDIIVNEAVDACGEVVSITIGRVGADGDLEAVDYSEQVLLGCSDVGTLTVAIRVEDESGNVNYCDSEILVEMKDGDAPTCVAPSAVTMTCEEFSGMAFTDIMESTQDERDNAFGTATGVGMCQTVVTDEVTVSNLNECGVGTFVRSFTVTQTVGDQTAVNTNICTQLVTIVGSYDYQFILPGDATVSCTDEITADSVEVSVGGTCDLVTITETREMVENTPGDECRQLRITYDIINTCEYDPALGGVTVLSRDGNGVRTSSEDVLYFNLIANSDQMTADDVAFYSSSDDRFFQNEATTVDSELIGYANSNGRGRFQYTQIINIIDRNSPVLAVTAPTECIAAGGNSCLADVNLDFSATDECSDLAVTYEVDANYVASAGFTADDAAALGITISDTADEDGNVSFTAADVPAGNHALRITATDDCGNATSEVIEFCVSSDLTPAPLCIQTLVAPLSADNDGNVLAQVWATDFVPSPVIDCAGNEITSYSIYTDEEANDGEPVEEGRLGIDVTCADEGFVPVRIYAFSNGNASNFCQAMIEVQDPDGLCPDGITANIAGVIVTEQMNPIENTEVDLAGPSDMTMSMTTTADGTFSFSEVPMGDDYTITPSNYLDYLNGVRTSDIVVITRHILAVEMLDSPYKMIAADVDGNGEINVGDIISIRRLILGLSDTYPNGMPSWSFIPADYEFANLDNPWVTAFPELINVNNLAANIVDADFIGVKLGDVNDSARANALMPAVPRNMRGSLELEMHELELEQGLTYRVPVTAAQLTEVDGYQFTFEFDRTAIEVAGIEAGLVREGNFGLRFVDQGIITTSWNWTSTEVPTQWGAEEVLFTLVIKAKANVRLSDAIEAGSRYTEAEAYERNGAGLRNLDLIFNEDIVEVAGYRLLQNIPNPVKRESTIGFELPQAHDKVTIAVTDAAGRLVREFTQEGYVGYNSLKVTKRQLGGTSGVFSYTVSAGEWVATKRMVIIE